MKLEELQKELPYKWRVQSSKYGKSTCVAYIDARDCQDLLDEVIGPDKWSTEYYESCGLLMCRVGVHTEHGWVWNVEKDKGHVSDAFKRACVSWGIGRFLYRLPIQTLQSKEYKGRQYPYAPEKDKIIFDGETLTKYINWKIKNGK